MSSISEGSRIVATSHEESPLFSVRFMWGEGAAVWAYDFSWLGPTNNLRIISKIGDTKCQSLR